MNASKLIVLILVIAFPAISRAQVAGDHKELSNAAAANLENLGKLKTWSGEVAYTEKSLKSVTESGQREYISIEAKITFAIDVPGERSRVTIETMRDDIVKGDESTPRLKPSTASYINRDGRFYELHIFENIKTRRGNIRLEPMFKKPGDTIVTFHPMYFFTINGQKVDDRWTFFATSVGDPKFPGVGEIARDGDLVSLRIKPTVDGDHGWFKTTLDLAQGANPVSQESVSKFPKSTMIGNQEWRWQKLADVYVPAEFHRLSKTEGEKPDETEIMVLWSKSVVNEPIADDEFGLGKLGLRVGDTLTDWRDNSTTKIKDPAELK
jgi:hypothetical protein